MSLTPPASSASDFSSQDGPGSLVLVRSLGFLGATLTQRDVPRPVRISLHDSPVVAAATSQYLHVKLTNLSAVIVPRALGLSAGFTVHLAWGHVEHAYPTSLEELVQLPSYTAIVSASSENLSAADRSLSCAFSAAITADLKPVPLVGGRPALFYMFEVGAGLEEKVTGNTLDIVVRLNLRCAGADISFI